MKRKVQFCLRMALCVVVVLSIVCVVVVDFSALAKQPGLKLAHKWVNSHRDNLPRTFDEISLLSRSYRLEVFSALTPHEKTDYMRAKLEGYLQHNPQLTGEQQRVIKAAIALVKPEFYMHRSGTPERKALVDIPIAQWELEAFKVFSKIELGRIGTVAGPDIALAGRDIFTVRRLPVLRIIAAEKIKSFFTASATSDGWCDCAGNGFNSWDCQMVYGLNGFCDHSVQCEVLEDRCGFYGNVDCTGQCIFVG